MGWLFPCPLLITTAVSLRMNHKTQTSPLKAKGIVEDDIKHCINGPTYGCVMRYAHRVGHSVLHRCTSAPAAFLGVLIGDDVEHHIDMPMHQQRFAPCSWEKTLKIKPMRPKYCWATRHAPRRRCLVWPQSANTPAAFLTMFFGDVVSHSSPGQTKVLRCAPHLLKTTLFTFPLRTRRL